MIELAKKEENKEATGKKEEVKKVKPKTPEEIFEAIKKEKKDIDNKKGAIYLAEKLKEAGIPNIFEEILILDSGKWKKDYAVRYNHPKNQDEVILGPSITYKEIVEGEEKPKKHIMFSTTL